MAVFRTGPFFGVDLALNMTSVLPVCFYGTFETEPFFWEGGGTNAVHSSTPPRPLLWGELVALKRTKFFFL